MSNHILYCENHLARLPGERRRHLCKNREFAFVITGSQCDTRNYAKYLMRMYDGLFSRRIVNLLTLSLIIDIYVDTYLGM